MSCSPVRQKGSFRPSTKKGSRHVPCSLQSGSQRTRWHKKRPLGCSQSATTGHLAILEPRATSLAFHRSLKPKLLFGPSASHPRQLVVTADIQYAPEWNAPRSQIRPRSTRPPLKGCSSPITKAAFGNCAAVLAPRLRPTSDSKHDFHRDVKQFFGNFSGSGGDCPA